jgi:bisphosphoglycerate-dependent phosphoglycerate mutase
MDKIKKRILLVRHGTTAYNETDRLQGRIDNPLSDKGRDEAERLAARLFRTGNAALSRLLLMENDRRSWAVVDFWNSTSHLGSLL